MYIFILRTYTFKPPIRISKKSAPQKANKIIIQEVIYEYTDGIHANYCGGSIVISDEKKTGWRTQ